MNIAEIFLLCAFAFLLPNESLGFIKWMFITSYLKEKNISSDTGRYIRATKCEILDVRITNCDQQFSRLTKKSIRARYNKTCSLKKTSFTFHFKKKDLYSHFIVKEKPEVLMSDMKKELEKHKTVFASGSHSVYVTMDGKTMRNEDIAYTSGECSFYIIPEKPTADLGKRMNKHIPRNKQFVVDASKSMNNDIGKPNVGLEYKWSCTDTDGFCDKRDLGRGPKITVDKKYTQKEGESFHFIVSVRTPLSEWVQGEQIFTVNSSAPFIVNCLHRCGTGINKWNPQIPAATFVECQFNCRLYDLNSVQAKIIEVETGMFWEREKVTTTIFLFPMHKPNRTYLFRITAPKKGSKVREVLGEQEFKVHSLPVLKNCEIKPSTGNTFTKFKIECNYTEKEVKYFDLEIKSKNNATVFSTKSDKLEDIKFVVPSSSKVLVTLHDSNDVEVKWNISMDIEPIVKDFSNTTSVVTILNDIYDGKTSDLGSVVSLIEEGDHKTAIQATDIIARELSKVVIRSEEDGKSVDSFKNKLLGVISTIPIDDFHMALSVSGVLNEIAHQHQQNVSHSETAKILSDLCKEVAKKQLYIMENESEGEFQEDEVNKITNNLFGCTEKEFNPHYEIFNETAVNVEISTMFPINENLSENNFEDYPMYTSDDLIEISTNNFLELAENVIKICRDMGRTLTLAVSTYNELPTYIESQDTIVAVFKSEGTKIADTIFRQHNVTFVPSPFLRTMDTVLSVELCILNNDPFWSASQKRRIPTNVLDVTLIEMAEEIELVSFGGMPMNISFDIVRDRVEDKVKTLALTKIDRKSSRAEDEFRIIRIEAKAKESFFIEFIDIADNHTFEAIVIDMERPMFKHFSNSYLLTKSYNKLFIAHEESEDEWFFLVVIPKEDSMITKNGTVDIKFGIYSPKCMGWNYNLKAWKSECPILQSTTRTTIHCSCYHLSTFAGYLEYNSIKEYPKFIAIDFVLESRGSLHIVITVCVIILIYFLLLIYSVQKNETKEDAVYFLSDVPSEDRYGYLIETTTGRKFYSGTSSHIVIQIFGTSGKTKEHVINFPDPCLEILQRHEKDLFVLGTQAYLGQLVKINIWSDCTGIAPNWYCDEIKICDLQTRKWYAFRVKQWLRVDGNNPRLFISVPPSLHKAEVKQEQSSRIKLIRNFLSFGSLVNTIWKISSSYVNPRFGYPKRLSVLLSLLLTLMTITMVFYGTPEFLPRDAITPDCYLELEWEIVHIGLYSSVLTFFPHVAIVKAFLHSEIQFHSKRIKGSITLPPVFTLLLWGILIVNIFAQIHLLLIYGYWIIYPVSLQWSISSFIAVIFYVFILDYLWNITSTLLGAVETRVKMNYDKILRNIEIQRAYLYNFLGRYIYRPILSPIYGTMTRIEYMRKRLHFRQKRHIVWQIQDLIMVTLFIALLYEIVMETRDTTHDILGHNEARYLVTGFRNTKLKLARVTGMNTFEKFIEQTFIPNLQSHIWYGKYVSQSPGMTTDESNRYLGIIRLKQFRIEENTCNVSDLMQFVNRTCSSPSYYFPQDYLNYTPAWEEAIADVHDSRLGYVWGYQNEAGESYSGSVGYYDEGGYVALLGRTIRNSFVNFIYLRRYHWIDIFTRAIIIEFPLYNVNTNLFHFVTIVLEKTPTGYIKKNVAVHTTRIMRNTSQNEYLYTICNLMFFGLVVVLIIRIAKRIMQTNSYKRDIWQVLDIVIAILCFALVIIYFRRLKSLEQFVKELEEERSNDFVDYFDILNNVLLTNAVASILICLSTIRIWKLLRFATVFRIAERTIINSFTSLVYLFMYYVICCIGFGGMAFIVLGENNVNFKDVYSNMKTLILMTIGLKGPNVLRIEHSEMGLDYAFIILFNLFSLFFNTVFVAIIVVNFLKAQEFSFEEKLSYNMKDYAVETVDNLKRFALIWFRKFRLNAGNKETKEEEMVSPKSTDVRYMNCVSVDSSRMRAMESVAKCVLRKRKRGTKIEERDYAQMLETVRNLSKPLEGQQEFFFTKRTEELGCVFVDDNRLLMMEEIVKRMLRPEAKEESDVNESLRAENLAKLEALKSKLENMLRIVDNIEIKIETR